MQTVCNAVQLAVPPPYPLVGVPAGMVGEANTEGLAHQVGLSPPAIILRQRGRLGEGRILSLPWANSHPGRQGHQGGVEPDLEGSCNMGQSRTGPPGG